MSTSSPLFSCSSFFIVQTGQRGSPENIFIVNAEDTQVARATAGLVRPCVSLYDTPETLKTKDLLQDILARPASLEDIRRFLDTPSLGGFLVPHEEPNGSLSCENLLSQGDAVVKRLKSLFGVLEGRGAKETFTLPKGCALTPSLAAGPK